MTETKQHYAKPSDLLAVIDSHGIYNVAMLEDCEFDTDTIPTATVERRREEIDARGLGGYTVGDLEDETFTGWGAAEALAEKYLGENPGKQFMGRGRIFNACKSALKADGF